MVQKNYSMRTLEEAKADIDAMKSRIEWKSYSDVLVHFFESGLSSSEAKEILDYLHETIPKAKCAGIAMYGVADSPDMRGIKLNFCLMESSHAEVVELNCNSGDEIEAAEKLRTYIERTEDLAAVEIYPSGLDFHTTDFLERLTEGFDAIPFYGSMANGEGVAETIEECEDMSFSIGNSLVHAGVVMVILSGKDLHVQMDYLLGWKPVGREMSVELGERGPFGESTVSRIDGQPAANIYEKYLGVVPNDYFIENICEFPLVIRRNGWDICRIASEANEKGELYFVGNINEGETLRLSYASKDEMLGISRLGAERMGEFQPDCLFVIACGNRINFLQEDAMTELGYYEKIQEEMVFCHGQTEICRQGGKGGVLNGAFVAVGIREGESCPWGYCQYLCDCASTKTKNRAIPLEERLEKFLETMTHELEDAARAANAANMAKTAFLSNMSHEIRTPINAVLGMDEMILRECKDEVICNYAENIRTSGNTLLGLINDILDFSKIEAGKMDIIEVDYDFASVLNDLVNMIKKRAEDKGLTLQVEVNPALPNLLHGDEIRIKQIVTNILTNAVKYTEKGGIVLKADYRAIEGQEDIALKVSVCDTGIGIKKEDQAKLFSAFERIEEKRNRSIEGTGLGMNITQRLLSLMGSTLEVESEYGRGSVFSFELKQGVVKWDGIGDYEEAFERSIAQRKTYQESFTAPDADVLVVDDTRMNLVVFQNLLKRTLVRIDTAESGLEALKMTREKHYDIIFMDHRMPGKDGIETLKDLRDDEENLNRDTPAISLTANAVSGARQQYIGAGFQDYLTKPIDSGKLEAVMVRYLPYEKLRLGAGGNGDTESAPAETKPEEALPEWLKEIEGLNSITGKELCGSLDSYMEALGIFYEAINSNAEEIEAYWRDGDIESYTVKVHALKSMAKVIGAMELSEKARLLEDAGNAGDREKIDADTEELLNDYRAFKEKLKKLDEDSGDDSKKALIDLDELQDAYEAMREIAGSFDYDSLMMVIHSLDEYAIPETEQKKYNEIKAAAVKPDWDRIKELLEVTHG